MKNLAYKLKPPCSECPYKRGLVQTVVNPCPQCRSNGYRMLGMFQKQQKNDH